MRVLLISHTCQSRTEGQPKAHCLGQIPGIDLRVVVPRRWKHYGAWREAEPALSDTFDYQPTRVRFPWVGPAQFYLHHYPDLSRIFREFQPDVIDLWEEPWSMVSWQACRLRRSLCPGARLITETEQNIDKRLPFPFEYFRRYTLARADFAVCRNSESAEILRRKGFAGPTEVVGNGVDTDLFRPLDKARCRLIVAPDWTSPELFVLGYAGRLVEEKGLADLVAALALSPPHVRLILVGDGPFAPALRAQAAAAGLEARVRFLSGRPLAELPQVMNALDAFVLPSRTTARWKEQFGRVIIEAQACGVPVLGSDSGAIPDVVGAGGIVFKERDPAALAAAVSHLASDRPRALAAGAAGQVHVRETYTWARVAARMGHIYARLAALPSAGGRSAPARAGAAVAS